MSFDDIHYYGASKSYAEEVEINSNSLVLLVTINVKKIAYNEIGFSDSSSTAHEREETHFPD